MTVPVPSDVIDQKTRDRVREIIDEELHNRMATAWGLNASDVDDEGLYLPPPEAVYGKTRPGLDQILETHDVAVLVGFAGDSERFGLWTGGQGGDIEWRRRPVGIRILVNRHASDVVPDNIVSGQNMRRDTKLVRRTDKYVASTKWILQAYGHQTGRGAGGSELERSIKRLEVDRDTSDSYEITYERHQRDKRTIFGAGNVRAQIIQESERPQKSHTP